MLKQLFNSRQFLWAILTLPGVITLARYATGATFYGEVLHFTGELAARLLILTMAVTPLALMFPGKPWVAWLRRRRRYLGMAVFGYALLHTVVYAIRRSEVSDLLAEAIELPLLTGWVALFFFLPLAVTSNNWATRRLGRGWKRLHRWVYLAALLTFVHWILAAFDPIPGAIHLGVLAALEIYRVWRGSRPRPSEVKLDPESDHAEPN